MSSYNLEEQEKLAELKAWWRQYGNALLLTLAVIFGGFGAYKAWQNHRASQASEAGMAYSELQKAAMARDVKKVRDLSGSILEAYPSTVYASLAALVSAKTHLDSGDRKTARAQLEWVANQGADDELKSIARVRLAGLLLDDKAYDEALKLLESVPSPSFEGAFAAVRGDTYLAQGKSKEAREAYEKALASTPASENPTRELLQTKLDALGGA